MKRTFSALAAAAVLVLVSASLSTAQIRATDPELAGPDFPFQGKYLGKIVASNGTSQDLAARLWPKATGPIRPP
jgi:hypothetical protein